jgi:hypothetical protein
MPKMTVEVERKAGALDHQEKADRMDRLTTYIARDLIPLVYVLYL